MSDVPTLRDRYFDLIDQIVQTTLKGNIRSREQVYQMLSEAIQLGTGEVFEGCLEERLHHLQRQLEGESDELKQAKASRSLRALQTIRSEWNRWQTENQAREAIARSVEQILTADPAQRLLVFVQRIDPNRVHTLSLTQLKPLAIALQTALAADLTPEARQDIYQLVEGIERGLASWEQLRAQLIDWVYDEPSDRMGFEGAIAQNNPWISWAKFLTSPLPVALFQTLGMDRPLLEFALSLDKLSLSDWVELLLILLFLHQTLITWFEQRIYNTTQGTKASISTFLALAIIWSQLATGLEQAGGLERAHRDRCAQASFQVMLQILRTFAQRSYFPLYGGVFAAFPGSQLRSLVNYLNGPLKQVEGTQEKARILTLLGASERAQGQLDVAKELHDIAREMAAEAGDHPCEIANLNHLSRTCAAQKQYTEAIDYSQRALILSRQVGDRSGEANALVNLGYSQVFRLQQLERAEPEVCQESIHYLQQGLRLAEQLSDRQSLAFAYNSLGMAYLLIDQPETAVTYLTDGLKAVQVAGDLHLRGLDLAYLAEAYYRLNSLDKAIYTACTGMYFLERIASRDWRQPAGLLTILQGQLGDHFQIRMQGLRPDLVAAIGVEGYESLFKLIEQYRYPTE